MLVTNDTRVFLANSIFIPKDQGKQATTEQQFPVVETPERFPPQPMQSQAPSHPNGPHLEQRLWFEGMSIHGDPQHPS